MADLDRERDASASRQIEVQPEVPHIDPLVAYQPSTNILRHFLTGWLGSVVLPARRGHLREFGQFRIQVIPRLRTFDVNIHLWLVQTGIVEIARTNQEHTFQRVRAGEQPCATLRTKPLGFRCP